MALNSINSLHLTDCRKYKKGLSIHFNTQRDKITEIRTKYLTFFAIKNAIIKEAFIYTIFISHS